MNGSPATSIIDFGIVAVRAPKRVARPPASIAIGGKRSDFAIANFADKSEERVAYRLVAVKAAIPPKTANALCIQAYNRHVALPAAIAARILQPRPKRQFQTFDHQLCDCPHGEVVPARHVEGFEPLRAKPSGKQNGSN